MIWKNNSSGSFCLKAGWESIRNRTGVQAWTQFVWDKAYPTPGLQELAFLRGSSYLHTYSGDAGISESVKGGRENEDERYQISKQMLVLFGA